MKNFILLIVRLVQLISSAYMLTFILIIFIFSVMTGFIWAWKGYNVFQTVHFIIIVFLILISFLKKSIIFRNDWNQIIEDLRTVF